MAQNSAHEYKLLPNKNFDSQFLYRFSQSLLRKMSPIYYVQEGKSFVPFLIAHGDADTAVDFSQSAELVKRLEECGADVSFICVEGAVHEGNFWSQELLAIFKGFLDKQAGLK